MGKLTALKIATLGPGFHSDGDGLFLQVTRACPQLVDSQASDCVIHGRSA